MHAFKLAQASISQLQFTILRIENCKIYRFELVRMCVCVRKNVLQKFFSKLTQWNTIFLALPFAMNVRRMHSIPYIITAVWKVSTIFNCNFTIANTNTKSNPFTFALILYCCCCCWFFPLHLCDKCKFTRTILQKLHLRTWKISPI